MYWISREEYVIQNNFYNWLIYKINDKNKLAVGKKKSTREFFFFYINVICKKGFKNWCSQQCIPDLKKNFVKLVHFPTALK